MNGLSSSSSLGVADAGQDARSPRGLRHTPMFMCCLGRGLHASQLPCRLHYSAVAPPPPQARPPPHPRTGGPSHPRSPWAPLSLTAYHQVGGRQEGPGGLSPSLQRLHHLNPPTPFSGCPRGRPRGAPASPRVRASPPSRTLPEGREGLRPPRRSPSDSRETTPPGEGRQTGCRVTRALGRKAGWVLELQPLAPRGHAREAARHRAADGQHAERCWSGTGASPPARGLPAEGLSLVPLPCRPGEEVLLL